MNAKDTLTAPEQRIEEIREIRRRLFGGDAVTAERLRELGNQVPAGFRVLRSVRPIEPLSRQLEKTGSTAT